MLFLGSGDRSGANCFKLIQLLHKMIGTLGGLQQPCHCEHEFCACSEIKTEGEEFISDGLQTVVDAFADDATVLYRKDGIYFTINSKGQRTEFKKKKKT